MEGVNRIWRDAKLRGVGLKRAKTLVEAAEHSIGNRDAQEAARIELRILLADYELQAAREAELMAVIEEKITEVPYIDKLLEIRGVGMKTVIGFVAEVGDIKRFDDPKQLQKLAGYAIVKNESGKQKGESHISYRGRKRLRYVLYEAAVSVVSHSPEFKDIHRYYTSRERNPLKKNLQRSLQQNPRNLPSRSLFGHLLRSLRKRQNPQKLLLRSRPFQSLSLLQFLSLNWSLKL